MGGGKITDHHNFPLKVYRALNCFRSQKFVEKMEEEDYKMGDHCTAVGDRLALLLKIETAYKEFCESLKQSGNEQTRICAMFLKKVGS